MTCLRRWSGSARAEARTLRPVSELAIHRGKYIGARVTRLEDPGLLAGEARYVADLTLPRMLHAAFVRSPVPHATIRSIDTAAAEALAGVETVFTAADITAEPLVDAIDIEALEKTPVPMLATDRVRFVGEGVAVVVAVDQYIAEDAAALVEVEYDDLGVSTTVEEARAEGAEQLFDHVTANTIYDGTQTFGDPDAAFANADRVYSARYVATDSSRLRWRHAAHSPTASEPRES